MYNVRSSVLNNKDLIGFHIMGLKQWQILIKRSGLEKVPCNFLFARPDLLNRIHNWSQGRKNHALTDMCSFKRREITLFDQVRISYFTQNILVKIILVIIKVEKICYDFNHSQCCQAYTKQQAICRC
jgi:hypothetical protein